MKQITIRDAKIGEFIVLSDPRGRERLSPVWIRGEYDRASKRYSMTSSHDFSRERFMKGDRVVWSEFEY